MQVPDDGLNMYSKWDTYYTVIFDTQGGSTIPQQSVLEGNTVSQPYNPTRAGFTFDGWYTDPDCTQKATFPYTVRSSVTFYAKWEENYTTKYAVCLWGIDQDVDENGNQLGLTFGPATGGDYRHAYKACPNTTAESPGNCLHWMAWSEIIEQSKKNPHCFDACLTNGCTHEVKLNITGKLAEDATDFSGQFDDGDGASCLLDSINPSYRKWNNERSNTGGWPASRVRATLNGQDGLTDTSVAGEDCLSSSNCLLAMFPQELQSGIVAKTVKSDTVHNDLSGNNKTTYDKLWLFSGKEVYGDSGSNNDVIRKNEGELYQRAEKLGITTSSNRKNLKAYSEGSGAIYWWLRSSGRYNGGYVYDVHNDGDWNNNYAVYDGYCLAPGFCLE